MNILEKKMVDVLKDLRDNYHVYNIKAEFEAEGTRMEEALRLKEVITKAGMDMTIKIGGCEAIKDMFDARSIGVTNIVAPMIESSYALKKYLQSVKLVFPEDELSSVKYLFNLETIQGYQNYDAMLNDIDITLLGGVVLGRVDFTGSIGKDRDYVNSEELFEVAKTVLTKAKAKGLDCVVGGGVSKETVPFLQRLPAGCIDRYETRKVIFSCPDALSGDYENGILKAVGFELMWLKNKRNFYGMIYEEDANRIVMLEKRYKKLIEEAGGKVE